MKNSIIILFLGLILISCKKSNIVPYQNEGILTGYDNGACSFCGGIEIKLKNDTAKNPPSFYRIDESLQQLGINSNAAFPINVTLNFKHDTSARSAGNYIIVYQIKATN